MLVHEQKNEFHWWAQGDTPVPMPVSHVSAERRLKPSQVGVCRCFAWEPQRTRPKRNSIVRSMFMPK